MNEIVLWKTFFVNFAYIHLTDAHFANITSDSRIKSLAQVFTLKSLKSDVDVV